jgi:hypothetical protein
MGNSFSVEVFSFFSKVSRGSHTIRENRSHCMAHEAVVFQEIPRGCNAWPCVPQLRCTGCIVILISSMEKKLDSFKTLTIEGLKGNGMFQASK